MRSTSNNRAGPTNSSIAQVYGNSTSTSVVGAEVANFKAEYNIFEKNKHFPEIENSATNPQISNGINFFDTFR